MQNRPCLPRHGHDEIFLNMGTVILIAVVIIVCSFFIGAIISSKTANDENPEGSGEKPVIRMLNREGDPQEDEWHTYIAGLPHYVSKYDIGGFTGWVENDFGNRHDPKAMGVYNSDGKLLGYIPAKELADYRDWCDAMPQPCVGFIFVKDGELRGRVKILRPCNKEFLANHFGYYLQWVRDNYGPEYLPKSLTINFVTE